MRIVGIEKEDIKRVIKSSTYGFDYVELQNGAKVIVNQRPILLSFGKIDSIYELPGNKCIFNYPMLEKILDDGKGGIEFDDKKMVDYIAERLVWDNRTPQEWAEDIIHNIRTRGKPYRTEKYCVTFTNDLEFSERNWEQIPIEAFQNHPKLLGEIKKEYSKQLYDKNKYIKASNSKYSEEEIKWLSECLNDDVKREERLHEKIAQIETRLGKSK